MDQLLPVEAGREQLLVGTNLRAGLQTREGFTKLLKKLRTNLLHHLQVKLCFFHEKLSPKYFSVHNLPQPWTSLSVVLSMLDLYLTQGRLQLSHVIRLLKVAYCCTAQNHHDCASSIKFVAKRQASAVGLEAQCNIFGDSGPKKDSRPTDTELNAAKQRSIQSKSKEGGKEKVTRSQSKCCSLLLLFFSFSFSSFSSPFLSLFSPLSN